MILKRLKIVRKLQVLKHAKALTSDRVSTFICQKADLNNRGVKKLEISQSGAGKFFWVVPLHIFALEVQLVVLVSAFVMVSTVFFSFLLAVVLLTVPL